MHRFNRYGRSLLGLTACSLIAAACFSDENKDVLGPDLSGGNSIFQSYVALGNSITAGYQSSGINDSTQRRAYPVLLAAQMGTRFAYPALAGRGCAPPIVNFLTQARAGTGSTSTTCDLRSGSTEILNNLGVPGATVADLTAETGTSASNILTSLILGGETQVQNALEADPTFASIWIGNNDVLVPAVAGVLTATPSVSPGVTSQASFEASYNAALVQLTADNDDLKGVLVGVVNVTGAPILFPVAALQTNPAFLGGFDQASGRVATSTDPFKAMAMTIDANCAGAAAATLVSFRLATEIARFRNDTNATGQPPKAPTARAGHPPHIACGVSGVPYPAPVGEVGILTTTEQAALATAVTNYNAFIAGKATELGWAYVNPNVLLDSLRTAGAIPVAPNLASGTATFGSWVSLDGVHPTDRTHRAITNHIINAINATYSTSLTRISVP